MNYLYRRINLNDVELISKARVEFLEEADGKMTAEDRDLLYSEIAGYFRREIPNNNFTGFLAFDKDGLAATSGINFYTAPPDGKNMSGKVANIQNIYTLPQHRGKGIASRLMSMLIEEAKERGCDKIILNATDAGRRIYEKLGFTDLQNEMVLWAGK